MSKIVYKTEHFTEEGPLKKMKFMVTFQYPICGMHFGIVKDELINDSFVRFAFKEGRALSPLMPPPPPLRDQKLKVTLQHLLLAVLLDE